MIKNNNVSTKRSLNLRTLIPYISHVTFLPVCFNFPFRVGVYPVNLFTPTNGVLAKRLKQHFKTRVHWSSSKTNKQTGTKHPQNKESKVADIYANRFICLRSRFRRGLLAYT